MLLLNYLWAAMILLGIAVAAFTGKMPEVTTAIISSSKEAVEVCISMLGVMGMWTGLMKIAEKGGVISIWSNKISPVLRFLFPTLKKGSAALEYISANFIANILGLGWAATPAGLKAMDELQKINPDKTTASREMCMFMIINMSSLQLITVTIIGYRLKAGSLNPSEIIAPGIFATLVSSLTAVVFAKIMERIYFKKRRYDK